MGLNLLSFMKKRSREEPKNTPRSPRFPQMSCLRNGRAGLSRFLHFFTQFPCSFRNAGFFACIHTEIRESDSPTNKTGPQHSLRPC